MAAMLVSSGTDIREVQEILGHASILSTQVYTRLPIQKRGRGNGNGGVARVLDASVKLPIRKK
jgi:integrase